MHARAAKHLCLEMASLQYIMQGLIPDIACCWQGGGDAILQHGTLFRLHSSYDTGIIFGDYYLLEAMNRGLARCTAVTQALSTPNQADVVIIDIAGIGPVRLYGR